MWSLDIVEVEVAAQAGHPLGSRLEGLGIGPFGEKGPDEAFGLAVGLGSIRPGPTRDDPELRAGLAEEVASVRVAVVGEDPLDRDALIGIERISTTQEVDGRRWRLVGQLLRVGESGVIVDRDMDPVPASPFL